jgi:hypothetical protein
MGAHLTYYGGRVVSNMQLVMVLWGTGFYESHVTSTGTPSMMSFYKQILGNGSYTAWLNREYNTVGQSSNQVIGPGGVVGPGPIRITPSASSSTVTDTQIQTELAAQIHAGKLPAPTRDAAGNNNTYYAIYFPNGITITQGGTTSCQAGGFCAYHGTSFTTDAHEIYYGVHPDMQAGSGCDTGCGNAVIPFGNYTSIASHEMSETITDAEAGIGSNIGPPLAWYDATNGEVADICDGLLQQGSYKGFDGQTYTTQLLFSNAQSNCINIPSFTQDAHDFNGDGRGDIVWRDGSGNLAFWLTNGTAVTSSGAIGGVPATWSVVAQRDFDGDGKADLLWRDTSGDTAMWFMNGMAVGSSVSVGNVPTTWSVIATGDFNGDGMGDIIWRDTSGNVTVWLMNGATVTSSVVVGTAALAWTVVGSGDYNGDGKSDLLWLNTNGDLGMWLMNGAQVASTALIANIPAVWSVVGIGDFNGDGKSDIVWRDNAGNTAIWLMNGASVATSGSLGNISTIWSIAQPGDYNGDGKSDLLWRDTSGNTAIWFMNGLTIASTGAVGNIPTSWTVQSVNAE